MKAHGVVARRSLQWLRATTQQPAWESRGVLAGEMTLRCAKAVLTLMTNEPNHVNGRRGAGTESRSRGKLGTFYLVTVPQEDMY